MNDQFLMINERQLEKITPHSQRDPLKLFNFSALVSAARLLIDELLVLIYNEGEEQKIISKRLIGGAEHGYIEHHT